MSALALLDIPEICTEGAFLSTAHQDPAGTQPSRTASLAADPSRSSSTEDVSVWQVTQTTIPMATVSPTAGRTKSGSTGSANAAPIS